MSKDDEQNAIKRHHKTFSLKRSISKEKIQNNKGEMRLARQSGSVVRAASLGVEEWG